jgi:Ca-activated chloride channel family protein
MKGEQLKNYCKFILFVFIACAVIFTPQSVRSRNAPNMDVVLVIDSSGSMQKTDPMSLRVPAAKSFISLLEEGDRAGIVSFSDMGYVLSDLTTIDSQENKDALFSAADRISADGLYTNLYEAFNSGYVALSQQK